MQFNAPSFPNPSLIPFPPASQVASLENNVSNDSCGVCFSIVKDDQKAVCCDRCGKWLHIKCTRMSVIQYEHYQINPEQYFECKTCRTCGVCEKAIAVNHKKIECNLCLKYVHIKCNKFDESAFKHYQSRGNSNLYCITCLNEIFPFPSLSNMEFDLTMQGINFSDNTDLQSLELRTAQQKLVNKLNTVVKNYNNNISNNTDDDDDDNDVSPVDCSYISIEEFKLKKFNSSREFSTLHLNIHSVEAHIDELRIILKQINYDFDVICLSESKILKDCEPKVDITLDKYQYPVGTPSEASKGGVLIYAKEGINFKPREDLTIYKKKELESYFIEVINDKQKNDIVGVIYRHPSMDQLSFIDDFMKPLIDKMQTENKKLFITGDYNFDLLNLENNETAHFFETMMSSHLMPTILLPTKLNTKKDTIIDNIFTDQINPEIKSGNLTITISDHLPSFFIMPKDNQNHIPKKQDIYVRDIKSFDKTNFVLDYLNIDWGEKLDRYKDDVNKATEFFFWKINKLLDKYMPWKKLSNKQYKRRFKPWINNVILNKIKDKNRKFKKFINCKDPNRKEVLRKNYKMVKNEITSLIRHSKKQHQKYFTEN